MGYIWQMRHAKNLMASIFLEYLLPKYKTIYSNIHQTALGFKFYKKMFYHVKHNGFKFSVFNTKTKKETEITDVDQMDNYFGDNDDFSYYRFKISK